MKLICAAHPELAAIARCVRCGHHLCTTCRHKHSVRNYCARCLPARVEATAAARAAPAAGVAVIEARISEKQPWLAAVFSLVPGLGQLYSGRFLRGAAFMAAALALREADLISPLLAAFFYVFNLFDAYRLTQIRNERQRTGNVLREFDDALFAVVGLLVLAYSAYAQGGVANLSTDTMLHYGSLALGLWVAHETRR